MMISLSENCFFCYDIRYNNKAIKQGIAFMKTTNRKSSEFTKAKQAFEANNLKGVWHGGLYVVYSYGWFPLFIYNLVQDCWLENSERYSVSTSKQRTQCHPGYETELRSLEQLKDMIACVRYQRDGQVA